MHPADLCLSFSLNTYWPFFYLPRYLKVVLLDDIKILQCLLTIFFFNQFLPSRLFYINSLDRFISSSVGIVSDLFYYYHLFYKFL